MGIIKVLPEIIANRIAAGEVIERPASIVKELVENSLDAGATRIEISIRHGGKSLIRVADDGFGMSADDAELAFQRHATSKIKTAEDLNVIESYGFRGEALPSIGAVSRTKLMTRLKGAASGTEVTVEGGHLTGARECPGAEGTIIEVRDLFFNTPARRKFMKSDATEEGHLTDMVSNIAMAKLNVHFVFKSQDKVIYDLLPGQSLSERAAAILGDETAKCLIELQGQTQDVKITGVIGKPRAARANRYGQSFYVNGRWIRSIGLSYALQGGYHGLLMQNQHPVAVIFIECDLKRVDVNVHPTKQEVRISNEPQIKSFLKDLVETRLRKEPDLAPSMQPSDTIPFPEARGGHFQRPGVSQFAGFEKHVDATYQKTFSEDGLTALEPELAVRSAAAEPLQEPILVKNKFRITKILGQIHHTFILAETEEGLMIVDQHAAHERIQFEALIKGWASGTPASQKLLMEEVLELPVKYMELMQESLDFFQKLGFEIEAFGENAFVIRAVPSIFGSEHSEPLIRHYLEELEEGRLRTNLENRREDIAAMIACKRKSVKAHDVMTAEAMHSLLEQLARCENPFNCPHGRPSFLQYSFADLEKQFKRKL
jgi:DNA mismatch repair protein MutL